MRRSTTAASGMRFVILVAVMMATTRLAVLSKASEAGSKLHPMSGDSQGKRMTDAIDLPGLEIESAGARQLFGAKEETATKDGIQPRKRALLEADTEVSIEAVFDSKDSDGTTRQLLAKKSKPAHKKPPPKKNRGLLSADSTADDAVFNVDARVDAQRQLKASKAKPPSKAKLPQPLLNAKPPKSHSSRA